MKIDALIGKACSHQLTRQPRRRLVRRARSRRVDEKQVGQSAGGIWHVQPRLHATIVAETDDNGRVDVDVAGITRRPALCGTLSLDESTASNKASPAPTALQRHPENALRHAAATFPPMPCALLNCPGNSQNSLEPPRTMHRARRMLPQPDPSHDSCLCQCC